MTPVDLIKHLARIHGLLDLADTDDTRLLQARLAAECGVDIVRTATGEAAYQRTVDRLNQMWTSGSGLDRFLF